MLFFTFSNEPRPIRLSEETRLFAYDSLNHKYGLDTRKTSAATLDHIMDFEQKGDIEKYNSCISEIVRQAPIRICENEKLSGAATLGMALTHNVPATYNGNVVFQSVSHLTIDFENVLKFGINKIEVDIADRLKDDQLTERQRAFLMSAVHCINEFRFWHGRYLKALQGRSGYEQNYKNLQKVPFGPSTSFYEAVQSIWFVFAFVRLCGNWPGIGRIDYLLGNYLKNDLESGNITLDEAREILAHFLIKGCEWVHGQDKGSGDAQHYQNLVLAGVDRTGEEVTNEVTYLILDILEELNISDFPTTVRLNSNTDEKLLRRIADVMKHGGGVLAIYNEEKIIHSLVQHGYPLEEARMFANDGCWEIQVPGKTFFFYVPFDALGLLLNDTLKIKEGGVHFESIEDIKRAFFDVLENTVADIRCLIRSIVGQEVSEGKWEWCPRTPCTVISLFEEGCIENAVSYAEGGSIYRVISPHIGGAADAGNSLFAIDTVCFKEKLLPLDTFLKILHNNWEGHEELRQYVLNKIVYYGNDNDESDAYTVEIVDKFAELTLKYDTISLFRFLPGVSTFGRQIEWRYDRPASPHGHRTGDILAANMGATPGSDFIGATALIKSYCKLNLEKQVTGAALDLKFLPSVVKSECGTDALIGLMRGFVSLGGCFLQPDVVDNSILFEAQKHPEEYTSLSIRVSGWNARFVTLDKEWQDMVIEKTSHGDM